MQSLARRQAVFTMGMLLCGCLEVALAFALVGAAGAEGAGYSVALCLVPGWMTVYSSDLMRRSGVGAYVVLVGTALRMLFVLVGLLVVRAIREDLGFREFAVWLVVSYLVALTLETRLVLSPPSTEAV